MIKGLIGITAAVFFTFGAFAQCLETSVDKTEIKWTAFKTPAKAGVPGTFKTMKLSGNQKGSSIEEVVTQTGFEIDVKSVHTKNAARDKKIAKFFFDGFKGGDKITGKFKKLAKGFIQTDVTMNGVTKVVPLKYEIKNNAISAKGHIDVLDFTLSSQLAAINKACLALHEGKTWSHVEIEILAAFNTCK